MIKIRYSDLPAGLHVRTAVQGRHTILYLLPGLTAAQRRAALHRARSNARVGHGPRLPTAGIAFARSADRIRTTARNSLAAVRVHPALLVPAMIVVVSVAVANVLLATVSIQLRPPETAGAARPDRRSVRNGTRKLTVRHSGSRQPARDPGVPGPVGCRRLGRCGTEARQRAAPGAEFPSPTVSILIGIARTDRARPVTRPFARSFARSFTRYFTWPRAVAVTIRGTDPQGVVRGCGPTRRVPQGLANPAAPAPRARAPRPRPAPRVPSCCGITTVTSGRGPAVHYREAALRIDSGPAGLPRPVAVAKARRNIRRS